MKLTPLDIQQQSFKRSVRGYDSGQIDGFLQLVREEWESILKENQNLKDQISEQEEMIAEFQEKERTLRETLITAQKMSSDLKLTAKKEAEIIVSQAELQADKIIHLAHGRLTEIIDEINQLKRQRAEFEGRLSGIITSHQRLLELQKDVRESSQIEEVVILPAKST